VVGVGNPHRGDDAVGPLVVEAVLKRLGSAADRVDTVVIAGDLLDLVLGFGSEQEVIVVDAMVSGGRPGTIRETDALDDLGPSGGVLSSHSFGIAEAVALARILERLPRSLSVIAIEAKHFGHFEPPSQEVSAAVSVVVDRIIERLGLHHSAMDLRI
jgi:hydrogenase maturation protease